MGFGRDRGRRPGRRRAFRTPKKRILIVCEGANTEPQYFRQFADAHRDAIVDVETAAASGVPLSVVREAKIRKDQALAAAKRGDQYLKYDAVWAAFDVDAHPHVPEALDMAKRNGIKVAMSNPCFELWLFLHLRNPPGMVDRHVIQTRLKKIVPDYDKNVDYTIFGKGYETAVEGAKRLDTLAADLGEPGRNPTTGVYKLTESIIPRKVREDSK